MTAHQGGTTTARLFGFAAPIYDFSYLQRWLYRPAQDEVIALLRADGCLNIADVGCGTGILADRIDRDSIPTRSMESTCRRACLPKPEPAQPR